MDRYNPPILLRNKHIHTIFASKYRSVDAPAYHRLRWNTPDKDFIDIDLLQQYKSDNLLILCHGLEGHSRRNYMNGMAQIFAEQGWDICAWNFRSCSGSINLQKRLYSHGDFADLDFVVREFDRKYEYQNVAIVGFSLGGTVIMNWLGEKQAQIPKSVRSAVAISAPCDISLAIDEIESGYNRLYNNLFLKEIKKKIRAKAKQFPNFLSANDIDSLSSIRDINRECMVHLGPYKDETDFYYKSSAIHRLDRIEIPLLLINAYDDPILSPRCYPKMKDVKNANFHHFYSAKGGHVAFIHRRDKYSFAERKSLKFVENLIPVNTQFKRKVVNSQYEQIV